MTPLVCIGLAIAYFATGICFVLAFAGTRRRLNLATASMLFAAGVIWCVHAADLAR